MKFEIGNISSNSPTLAVLTNPTELAKRKGNLIEHYPVAYKGIEYADAERMFQEIKRFPGDVEMMVLTLKCKLEQYPRIVKSIGDSGGSSFLEKCNHRVNGRNWWEGSGMDSPFIECLVEAYKKVIRNIFGIV